MAFKEVTDLNTDIVHSIGGTSRKTGKKNPTSIEGYYLGKREVADQKKKSGKSYIYIFKTPRGNEGAWGKTDMDRKMVSAPVGTMVRITFTGMQNTTNGEMYKYRVETDSDNTIEVTEESVPDNSVTESFEEQGYSDLDEDQSDNAQDVRQSDLAAATQQSAAERAARVKAMLNGKGKGK